jgi:hypothetical protein
MELLKTTYKVHFENKLTTTISEDQFKEFQKTKTIKLDFLEDQNIERIAKIDKIQTIIVTETVYIK